jgi:ferritin-like metal-binding protein YciE
METCQGIQGLLAEWAEYVEEHEPGATMDYYHLVTALKTERYEQTAYESLVELAERHGRDGARERLQANLDEDEETIEEIEFVLEGLE